MKFRRTTDKTVVQDLRAFAEWLAINAKASELRELAGWLNDKMDEWLFDDAFGTEGQTDPRGDHRK